MKHFTKLFALAFFALSAGISNAQDVGTQDIVNPDNGNMQYVNIPVSGSQVVIQNFGSSAVTPSTTDSIVIQWKVNGNIILSAPWVLGTGDQIAANGTITLTYNGSFSWASANLGSASQFQLCVNAVPYKNGSMTDPNVNNNELCKTYAYAGDNNPLTHDLAPINLTCSVPAYAAGANVPAGGAILTLTYDMSNAGSNQLPAGVQYSYRITVAGNVVVDTINAVTFNGLATPGQELHTINLATPIAIPMTPGQFDLCMKLHPNQYETNTNNDETCTSYIAVTSSVESIEDAPIYGSISYHNHNLNIEFSDVAKGMSNGELYELSGRKISEYSFDTDKKKNHQLDMSQLPSGMYVFNIQINGTLLTYKFAK